VNEHIVVSGEPAALLALLADDPEQAKTHLNQMLPNELLTLASAAEELGELAMKTRLGKLREEARVANTPCDRGYPLGGMNPRTDWCTKMPLYHTGMHEGAEGYKFSDNMSVRRKPKCGDPHNCTCTYGCDIP
jgi:hypothetical protein